MMSPATFEKTPCLTASIADLDLQTMEWFVSRALNGRATALPQASNPEKLLTHLELWREDHPTNGAILLFGRPNHPLPKSYTVKCSRFANSLPAKKPSKRVSVKGTLFDLVDGTLDFLQPSADAAFKLPGEVLREAIVNAVVHRDYTDERQIEVTATPDLIEIWNPGRLTPSLTVDMLRRPHQSIARNPQLSHCLYLSRYTERVGTGTRDMIMTTRGVGLPVPSYEVRDEGFLISFRAQ